MRWYRSLYWKIFLAIWLSSVLVILATAVIVGSMSHHERDAEVQEARTRALVERILERHEDGRGLEWLQRKPSRAVPGLRILELDTKRKLLDTLPRRGPGARPALTFELDSESGRRYRVQVGAWPQREQFGRFLGLLVSVQIVLILLVSALTSLLLTWLVVRPLKRLRLHTRALAQGDLAVRTDQKLAGRGDEIGELAREFDTMADYVERTLGASQRLMQDVSHELRAPLARLQAAAGLLEQRLGEKDPLLQRLNRECGRIDRLITEILSLSRLEALEPGADAFSVQDLVTELMEDIRFQQPDRQLSFKVPKDCRVRGNRQLLERALGNVFNNVLKHTPAGTAIELTHARVGKQHELRIRDHGAGVPAETLEQLFDPFFRQRNSTESDGYGLGLSIARRALRILGGSIDAHNHPDGGLEMLIRLPAA